MAENYNPYQYQQRRPYPMRMPYMQQTNNSPINDLVGLIGTIMGRNAEKRREAKMYGDIDNFGKQLDGLDYGNQTNYQDLGSQSNPNSDYMGKAALQQDAGLLGGNAAQLMKEFSPNGSGPTTADIGAGLSGQQISAIPGRGLLSGMAQRQQPIAQPQQQFFAMPNQQQAQTDTTATDQAQGVTQPTAQNVQTVQNPNDLMGQYSRANNPVTPNVSPPKTLQQQVSMIRGTIAPAAAALRAKGYDPRDFMPMLLQTTQDKIAEHTSNYTQQATQTALATLNSKGADDRTAAQAAMTLGQLGVKIPAGFIQAYKNPALSHVVVNAGGQQVLKSFNPKTGEYTDGGSIDVTNTPYQAEQLTIGHQNADANTTRANRPPGNGQPKQVHLQGASGQVYTPMQVQQSKDDIDDYQKHVKEDPTFELANSADWKRWKKAMFTVNDMNGNVTANPDEQSTE